MRSRKKKNTPGRLIEMKDRFIDIEGYEALDLSEIFSDENPIHIEIGAGKGRFITELAVKNPNINYIAFEKNSDVIAVAAGKADDIPNLRFINADAEILDRIFLENSISGIYLNFSDPWPKSGYKKRRLTHRRFLEKYKLILNDMGEIHFKTDNRRLFEFSLLEMIEFNMKLRLVSFDLHNEHPEDNIMTEYEEKFSKMGTAINKLIAVF